MRRRLPALLLSAGLLTAVLAACSDDGGGDDERAEETTTTTEEGRIELDPPEVELVEAGAEPRRELRLAPADDCASSTTMDQQITQSVSTGEGDPTGSDTHLQLDLTHLCTSVADDRIEYVTTYDDLRAPGDAAEAELYAGVRGTEITTVVDRRGNVLEVDTDAAAEGGAAADDDLAQSLQQASAPFPEEEVGVGAVWRTTSDRVANGIPSSVVTEYTVTSIEGTVVEATVESVLTFTKGPFQLRTPAGDVPAEVLEGELLGTGTIRWDLAGVSSTSDQTVSGSSKMQVDTADGQFQVEQTQTQHVVVSDRASG